MNQRTGPDLQVVPPSPADSTPLTVKQNASRKPKEADWSEQVWTAVASDYRTGTTYGKLSEIYGIPVDLIVRRKQREAWRRDLSNVVRQEIDARLAVGVGGDAASRVSDEQLVAAAAQRGVEVVQRHRSVLGDAIAALATLTSELSKAAKEAAGGKNPDLAFLGPKETLSEASLRLGNALARIVPLERKAFGLDDGSEQKPFEESLREWHAQKAAERSVAGG